MKMPDAVKTPNAVKIPDAVKMIVVPCYNEAARLQTHSFAEALGFDPNLRFQFVDDGSSDGTRAVLDELCDAFPGRCVAQSLPANRGKAEAVRQGMIAAFASDAEFVGYWDADLATPLSQLSRMIDALKRDESLDIVLGSRVRLLGRHIDRSGHRHVAGRIFATFSSLALRIPVY
ncbi:MAG: glycosyltransferase, partial [Planctomycetota bacterium]